MGSNPLRPFDGTTGSSVGKTGTTGATGTTGPRNQLTLSSSLVLQKLGRWPAPARSWDLSYPSHLSYGRSYSCLSATFGWTREARRAGIALQRPPTVMST